jgi:predicted ATP-dependent endonuclease of OLD family
MSCLTDSHDENNVISEIDTKRRMSAVFDLIHSIVDGKFIEDDNGLRFQESGINEPLDFGSVSAGVKTFLIIKRLLELGKLKDRHVLILDEPEIHLHPEWQLKFAELLILLQKEFSLTILLTTHSPYFVNAIETYSQKREVSDCCKYYLTENKEDCSTTRDVTDDTNPIYQLLVKPFHQLEEERDR